jgi:hypothetical protein
VEYLRGDGKGCHKMNKSLTEAIDILKGVKCLPTDGDTVEKADESEEEVEKALKASAVNPIGRRVRMHQFAAGMAMPQPEIGVNRTRLPHEPPVVPVRHVDSPFPQPAVQPVVLTDCAECGYVRKSLEECPRCATVASVGGESLPFHLRGVRD